MKFGGIFPAVMLIVSTNGFGQSSAIQTPPVIQQQVNEIQDRFLSVLEEECPGNRCFPVGCEVSNFLTLDESSTSSLPGLGEEPAKGPVQYKLTAVVCEFAHEANVEAEQINSIKQRLRQKVKKVGVNVTIRSRELQAKIDEPVVEKKEDEMRAELLAMPWHLALWHTILPFLPWLLALIVATLVFLSSLWGLRRLGKVDRRDPRARTRTSDLITGADGKVIGEADPTPYMLMSRITQLKDELIRDQKLIELTLKKLFDEHDIDELCLILRHFGPELLTSLKEKAEYRDTLTALSKAYDEKEVDDETPQDVWRFLNRLERSMTAAKVRIESQPLEDEFSFLANLEVDEFIGILRDINEQEALAAVAYAPTRLREKFFALSNASFTAKFVEHLTRVERMSDHFVRTVARKLRQIYTDKGDGYKTIRVDRIPLLEQALNSLDTEQRRTLVADLGRDNPAMLGTLAPAIFLDDSIPSLPDDLLTEGFLAMPPQEAGNYLASFEWGPKVLKRLNPRVQDSILPYLNPRSVNQVFVQNARKKLAVFVKSQDQKGTIDLRTINSALIGKNT